MRGWGNCDQRGQAKPPAPPNHTHTRHRTDPHTWMAKAKVGQSVSPALCFAAIVAVATLAAQTPPPEDARNTDIPNTDTHFTPKNFWRHASHGTLAQWETRKAYLRGQILAAAGLDPMP